MDTSDMISLIERAGLEWRSYAGRGMGGAECVGIAGAPLSIVADLMRVCRSLEQVQELAEALDGARDDSMSKGAILYFPRLRMDAAE